VSVRAENPLPRLLIIPVQWYYAIHEVFKPTLLANSSGHMDDIRIMLQSTIGSVVMFMSEKWNSRMVAEVATQVNFITELVHQRRPNFSGRISLVAHSLGTAIAYDMMRQGALSRSVTDVFFLGGNIGPYAAVMTDGPNMARELLLSAEGTPRVYNVMHPYDPLCYRLEPMMDPRWEAVPSVPIPKMETTYNRKVSRYWSSVKRIFQGDEQPLDAEPKPEQKPGQKVAGPSDLMTPSSTGALGAAQFYDGLHTGTAAGSGFTPRGEGSPKAWFNSDDSEFHKTPVPSLGIEEASLRVPVSCPASYVK